MRSETEMPMPLRVIPVLDLKGGHAVHAVAGDRDHYRPIRSLLHPGSDPIGLARAYRKLPGLSELYLADLDAIAGAPPETSLYRALTGLGLALWVDAGVRDASSLPPLLDSEVATIVVGLETVRGAQALAGILTRVGPERLVFSVDLRGGVPVIAGGAPWGSSDPRAIVREAVVKGLRRILLLDLARVGTGRGTGTSRLLEELVAAHPGVEFAAGGGVSGPTDLLSLNRAGASAVLVGSALHDNRIGAADLARLLSDAESTCGE